MPCQTSTLCRRYIVTDIISDPGTRLMRKLFLEITNWQSVAPLYSIENVQVATLRGTFVPFNQLNKVVASRASPSRNMARCKW